jgi:hypothetical protein
MWNIYTQALVGAILAAFFSYFTSLYKNNPFYLHITAYLWGLPLIFFYLLSIVWQKGNNALLVFIKNAALGVFFTLTSILLTLWIYPLGKINVVVINILLLIFYIWLYLNFKIYKLL